MKKIKRYSGVLVKVGNECLLCKRNSKGDLPGEWSVPAGSVEDNEHPMDAAYREFYEETNKKIKGNLKSIGFLTRKDREGIKKRGLLYLFLYEPSEKVIPDLQNAKDGNEHSMCSYFTKDNLPIKDKNSDLFRIVQKIL
jgi:ADP-ribose pyrophosphatase YjhB (NUDIX family)